MGTSQNQGVDLFLNQRLQIHLHRKRGNLIVRLNHAIFHQMYKQRAGISVNVNIAADAPHRSAKGVAL